MRLALLISFLFTGFVSSAQFFVHDTISEGVTGTYMQTLYEVDSGYFCVGMVPHPSAPGNPDQFLMGFMSNEGNWNTVLLDYDTLQDQRAAFSINQLIRNNAGNFVHCYSNCGSGNCYPRVKEVAPDGTIVRDTIFSGIIDSLGLTIFDFNNIYYDNSVDQLVLLINVADTARMNNGLPASGGLLYIRTNDNFEIIDSILLSDPLLTYSYLSASRSVKFSGEQVLMIQDQKQAGWDIDYYGKFVFYEIDNQGVATRVADYGVGQYERLGLSLISTSDSAFMFTYMQSFWEEDEWHYMNHVCKLDSNYNPVWDNPIDGVVIYTPVLEVGQFRIIETVDTNYVIAGGGSSDDLLGAQLTKFNPDGDQLWRRRFAKIITNIQDTSYSETTITDVIANSKGGYTMFGQLTNVNFNLGFFKYGYILETNCLGFMGPPEAAANYSIDNNYNVSFVNQSLQAGSYTWHFGDGTVLNTDEYTDSISHVYSGFGTYEVMLIAHGCDQEDTLEFFVTPALHSDPTIVTEGQGYFSIFPNPLPQGQQLFVYLNQLNPADGSVWLQFVSSEGKIAEEITVSATEGTYIIAPSLGAGMYQVNLLQGDALLQSRKLIVL